MAICPCGSKLEYTECCGQYLSEATYPKTAEALMRSRYTAYTQANIEYIINTMAGHSLVNFNPESAKTWAQSVTWLGLTVLRSQQDEKATTAYVEFIARFKQNNKLELLHEISEFELIKGRWYYIKGKPGKIGRNDPCPCGSGKKYKHCCNKL